jgi:hypothetical protein
VELEKRGVPTIIFGTKVFESLIHLQARAFGLPDPVTALIEHPLAGISLDEALVKSGALTDQVAAAMLPRFAGA